MSTEAIKNFSRSLLGTKRYVWMQRLLKPRRQKQSYGERPIEQDLVRAGSEVQSCVAARSPAAIGKLGAYELRAWFQHREIKKGVRRAFSSSVLDTCYWNAGIFPATTEAVGISLDRWETAARDLDIAGVWYRPGEEEFICQKVPRAKLVCLASLEPFRVMRQPWSAVLDGLRVVVISPFARSIERQYERRREVWEANPAVLPDFELRTVRAPFPDGMEKSTHANWVDALSSLEAELAMAPFDVALVGAGAFSLPLVAKAKALGATGVHLGGGTQLLFGILGRRWVDDEDIRRVANSAWKRPSEEERPRGLERVEAGCYW